ncbi:uroporphyrinogen-III synthase [Vibrio algarum]|uniref:Uroporphyrinogen-III synthase n=1 Tax=Vibrio algarum TaxID=3020714 RepID=A0ABT4YM87_9VIBR|nr:uroporphyrinogen-III synthase [Vibrio sp. KJ40-1]MDB1122662.1 uroporphyrinogen-III synthase [Vibrio sp. KJ40-1]
MVVLVTRPSPDGEALCDALSSSGIQVIYQPLIQFTLGKDSPSLQATLQETDVVIAVSKPAVEWANRALHSKMQTWPDSIRYLAIGQKTADKLSEVTAQKVHYPEVSDSEHLLQLPPLLKPINTKVTILRGNGGRELIREELLKRGARVEYCEVYQRQTLLFDGHSRVKSWKKIELPI